MKLIIFGGRNYADYNRVKWEALMFIKEHLTDDNEEIEIVSGACDVPGVLTFTRKDGTKVYGADGLGERFANELNFPVKLYPADWKTLGKHAGPIRNRTMGRYGTHALGFPGDRGTANMLKVAHDNKLVVKEVRC
jgi:hypothetical protein